jgi:hypothetical protein
MGYLNQGSGVNDAIVVDAFGGDGSILEKSTMKDHETSVEENGRLVPGGVQTVSDCHAVLQHSVGDSGRLANQRHRNRNQANQEASMKRE